MAPFVEKTLRTRKGDLTLTRDKLSLEHRRPRHDELFTMTLDAVTTCEVERPNYVFLLLIALVFAVFGPVFFFWPAVARDRIPDTVLLVISELAAGLYVYLYLWMKRPTLMIRGASGAKVSLPVKGLDPEVVKEFVVAVKEAKYALMKEALSAGKAGLREGADVVRSTVGRADSTMALRNLKTPGKELILTRVRLFLSYRRFFQDRIMTMPLNAVESCETEKPGSVFFLLTGIFYLALGVFILAQPFVHRDLVSNYTTAAILELCASVLVCSFFWSRWPRFTIKAVSGDKITVSAKGVDFETLKDFANAVDAAKSAFLTKAQPPENPSLA